MPTLTWMAPEGPPRRFPVVRRITTIGRDAANDVVVPHPSVAEHHAQLVFDGRDFVVQQIASAPLRLNGKKRKRSKVFHGDRIALGDEVELTFSIFDEVALDAPSVTETVARAKAEAERQGMRKLGEFSRRLLQLRSVREQLDALLDAVMEASGAESGFVVLVRDGERRVTVSRNVRGRLPEAVEALSDSIVRRVVESRRPLVVADALHDTRFGTAESVMNLQLASVMCAPLLAQGELLGVIYLGSRGVVRQFDESSLELLQIFAAQASLLLQMALLLDELESDRDRMAEELEQQRFGEIVGSCPSMVAVFETIEKVAPADVSVLITGETGTGKELVARELHRRSPRAKGPFVVVNCGAIPENLLESELFGHVRGAFTGAVATRPGKFQLADGGTLFLDEVGELPLPMQAKLLRALQEREVSKVGSERTERVDIRIVAATNRDLRAEVAEGSFREDLYYRLDVVEIRLPPLRERGEDVVMLARYLLRTYAEQFGSQVRGFTPHAIDALRAHRWPGNIRELQNRVKKAVILADKTLVGPADLDLDTTLEQDEPIQPLAEAREAFTRRYVLDALARHGGNRTRTAQALGVDPRTVFRYLEREVEAPDPSRGGGRQRG